MPSAPRPAASAFLADLRLTLAENQRDVVEKALEYTSKILEDHSEGELEKIARRISSETGCRERTAVAVVKCVTVLVVGAAMRKSEDDFNDFIAQISTVAGEEGEGLNSEEEHQLRELSQRLESNAAEIKQAFSVGRVIRGVLPMFQTLQATLEMRSTRSPLSFDEDPNAQLELVPIVSIQLIFDSGDPPAICFQAKEEDLAEIIGKMEKLQRELIFLKEKVRVVV